MNSKNTAFRTVTTWLIIPVLVVAIACSEKKTNNADKFVGVYSYTSISYNDNKTITISITKIDSKTIRLLIDDDEDKQIITATVQGTTATAITDVRDPYTGQIVGKKTIIVALKGNEITLRESRIYNDITLVAK